MNSSTPRLAAPCSCRLGIARRSATSSLSRRRGDPFAFSALGLDPSKLRSIGRVLSHSYFDELGAGARST